MRDIKAYKFEELNKDTQQEVIDKWYEDETYPLLDEDIEDELSQLDSFFSNVKVQYSLGWCQGDGLSIKGDVDFDKWIDENTTLKESVKSALKGFVYQVRSSGNGGRYCYASSCDIEIEHNYYKEYPKLEAALELILDDIKVYYMDLCKKLERYGYSVLEYRMDIAEFTDLCDANNYEYLEDGRMV